MELSVFAFKQFFLLLLLLISSFLYVRPICHKDEKHALLQFKRGFTINESASFDPFAYPKTESWKNDECCEWDGVECDKITGNVVGLDLSSSYLYGDITSNSTLFHIVHLKKLNLADNDFNLSQIPPEIHSFPSLTHLNLSLSCFSGQVPFEIAELSKLTSLDLSFNQYFLDRLLELRAPGFEFLLQNLSRLEELRLTYVHMPTSVPDVLGNLSSLRILGLRGCGLHGTFPIRIFQLPNLQILSLSENNYLTGKLPEFHQTMPLEVLRLGSTSFYGQIPRTIGNLRSLTELSVTFCQFSGPIPSSLGNITKLTSLNLGYNNFIGDVPSSMANLIDLTGLFLSGNNFSFRSFDWLGKLSKLASLDLRRTNMVGEIPSSVRNLTQLQFLSMEENELTGPIPFWLSNLTSLSKVFLESNNLFGPIPESISKLVNLQFLFLSSNRLNGTLKFDILIGLKNLVYLDLSSNSLSLLTSINRNASLPKYRYLGLALCNLNEFPDFLRSQDELQMLQLGGNNIHGQIPEWIWNVSWNSLQFMGLSYNFLKGFIKSSLVSQLVNLQGLDIRSNKLEGTLPMVSSSVSLYSLSNNSFSGNIPESICRLRLRTLELANNNLTGTLPQCLGNLSDSLFVLTLENNSFHGRIPNKFSKRCVLNMIDLSHNRLSGPLPRSLANCKFLMFLDLSNNRLKDTFPSWMGSLQGLQVLGLRSNKFYGIIRVPESDSNKFYDTIGVTESDSSFPKLRIIDLSSNSFTGNLPSMYFKIWNSMRFFEADQLTYMKTGFNLQTTNYTQTSWHWYSMVLTKAGIETTYNAIPNIMAAIDLSSNKFIGEIPESIASLHMLVILNLSNNHLTGKIPKSLKNIKRLDSLDLSLNNLSGEIPPELTQLTFLGFFNVSHNRLSGPVPKGTQFGTFPKSCFEGNLGLCGQPLSNACGASGNSPTPEATSEEDHGFTLWVEYEWMFVLAGCVTGLVIGVILGRIFTEERHKWFMSTFGRKQPRRRRQ